MDCRQTAMQSTPSSRSSWSARTRWQSTTPRRPCFSRSACTREHAAPGNTLHQGTGVQRPPIAAECLVLALRLGCTTGHPHYFKSASIMETDAHGMLRAVHIPLYQVSTDLEASCHLLYMFGLTAIDVPHVLLGLQLAQPNWATVTYKSYAGPTLAEVLPTSAAASRALHCLAWLRCSQAMHGYYLSVRCCCKSPSCLPRPASLSRCCVLRAVNIG